MPKFKRAGSSGGTVTKAGRKARQGPAPTQLHRRCNICYSKIKEGKCQQPHNKLLEKNTLPMNLGTIQKLQRAWNRMDSGYVWDVTEGTILKSTVKIKKERLKK